MRCTLLLAGVLVLWALMLSSGWNPAADAQVPDGTQLIVRTVFDDTTPSPPPSDISYSVLVPVSPTTVVPVFPTVDADGSFVFDLDGGSLFLQSNADPTSPSWILRDVACLRNDLVEPTITVDSPIIEGDIAIGAVNLTLNDGDLLDCTANFGWGSPERTLTFEVDITGVLPTQLIGVSQPSQAPGLLVEQSISVSLEAGESTDVAVTTDEVLLALSYLPPGWTLLGFECDPDMSVFALTGADPSSNDYVLVFGENRSPTCTLRVEAAQAVTVRAAATPADGTAFTVVDSVSGFAHELAHDDSFTVAIVDDEPLVIESFPPNGWMVESFDCGSNVAITEFDLMDGAGGYAAQLETTDDVDVDCVVTHARVATLGEFVKQGLATWDANADATTLATNETGDGAMISLKDDGRLFTRRISATGTFGPWVQLGRSGWSSADIAIDWRGRVEIVGVKADGRLFTRSWQFGEPMGPWTRHGLPTWDPTIKPAVATDGVRITIGAIKTDSRMYTRERTMFDSWTGFIKHGRSDWAHVDLAAGDDGQFHLVATKDGGRLYTRTNSDGTWLGFASHGRPTWSSATPPAITADANEVIFAAVKDNGQLYTRRKLGGAAWSGFVEHQGESAWVAAGIDTANDSSGALVAVDVSGRLATKSRNGGWGAWIDHGSDNWSTEASPSVARTTDGLRLVAVKAIGGLYTRLVG